MQVWEWNLGQEGFRGAESPLGGILWCRQEDEGLKGMGVSPSCPFWSWRVGK